jgi:mRNA interferase RelE/StbE
VFSVRYSKDAIKQLSKLDKLVARILYSWIGKNLDGYTDPYSIGKPLVGEHKGSWRYRIGSHRFITDIVDDQLIIIEIADGHRRDVY